MSSTNTTASTARKAPAKSSPKQPGRAAKQQPAKPAAQKPAALVFEQWRDTDDQWRAQGAGRYTYRITRTGDGWYAQQKGGQSGTYTPIAGKCATRAQAEDLCSRYEGGARQLSHRAYRELVYKAAVAKLAQQ